MTGGTAVLLALLLSGAPAADEAPPDRQTVLLLDLDAVDVDPAKLEIINGAIADQLSRYERLEVITAADIRQMVDVEAQKQAMGCDESSCLAEIADAMGAAYVVYGRVGQLDDVLFAQLNLFDSAAARAIEREEVQARSWSELAAVARVATSRVVAPLSKEDPLPMPEAGAGSLLQPLLFGAGGGLVGLGAVTAGIGGLLALLALDADGRAKDATFQSDAVTALDQRDGFALGANLFFLAAGGIAVVGAGTAAAGLFVGGE